MPTVCAVYGCTNKSTNKTLSFYRIPKVKTKSASDLKKLKDLQRNAWLKSLRRPNLTNKQLDYMRVCSAHFKNGKPAPYSDNKHPDWCPSVNLGYNVGGAATTLGIDRYQRPQATGQRESESTINEEMDMSHLDMGPSTSTSFTMADIQKLQQEAVQRNLQIDKLTSEVNSLNLSEKTFDSHPKMLTYYTGLKNIETFMSILEQIKPALSSPNQRLTEFQKLLLCLMKLRLNIPFIDLGFRFNITCSTASIIFRKVIVILEKMFKNRICWPDREALCSLKPQSFLNAFGNSVVVIIDCFEIEIEKPCNLKARIQTWSSYKNKSTVKYLFAITPQGVISFISEGWGGSTSGKHITENCNLLNNLLPGDMVLADRGFTNESVGFYFAILKTPAFTNGKSQLHPCSIEDSRKIASVRIHIERIIGLTKLKYKILNGPVQMTTLNPQDNESCILDSIVTVCCALINMCSSIVPLD